MKINFFVLSSLFFFSLFGENYQVVNLASFPRSGNHWVRFLVEEATGISTSSSYDDRDFKHTKNPQLMPGYSVENGYHGNCHRPSLEEPLLLKTHFPWLTHIRFNYRNHPTICLIRHPVDSVYSYYQYVREHYPTAAAETLDKTFLEWAINGWVKFYTYWEKKPGALIIRYEDLQENTEEVLTSILLKAGYDFKEEDIKRAVRKHASFGQPLKHKKSYTKEQLETINQIAGKKFSEYGYTL